MMNRKAREMGLGCTRFSSAYGLQPSNRSCAADLAALARADMRERRIARIVARKSAQPRFPIKGGHLFVNNTNPLLKQNYPGTIGLDSPNPAEQSKKLFSAGFRALRDARV
jgi:D-alanyl-D-alanine carboxypeptidase